MKLEKLERLILVNQFRILEKLYPDEADYYSKHRKAIEEGYVLHYAWAFEHLDDELSVEESDEVLEVLDMYRAITSSYEKIKDKHTIDSPLLKFKGFDGNNESKLMGYTQYFINDLERYEELKYDQPYTDFNSHGRMMHNYRRMLAEWKKCKDRHNLSNEELQRILETK